MFWHEFFIIFCCESLQIYIHFIFYLLKVFEIIQAKTVLLIFDVAGDMAVGISPIGVATSYCSLVKYFAYFSRCEYSELRSQSRGTSQGTSRAF